MRRDSMEQCKLSSLSQSAVGIRNSTDRNSATGIPVLSKRELEFRGIPLPLFNQSRMWYHSWCEVVDLSLFKSCVTESFVLRDWNSAEFQFRNSAEFRTSKWKHRNSGSLERSLNVKEASRGILMTKYAWPMTCNKVICLQYNSFPARVLPQNVFI